MPVRTSDSYQKEVFKKYLNDKGGEMAGFLASPTRRQIREACVYLIYKRESKYDEQTLDRFFQFSDEINKVREIQKFDADKFRPIVNFLKGKVHRTSPENIELISWLIDFQPRPLKEYLDKVGPFSNGKDSDKNHREKGENVPDDDNGDNNSGITKIDKKWWENHLLIKIGIALVMGLFIFGIQKWYLGNKSDNSNRDRCMTWADSHYVAVSCDEGPLSNYGTKVKPMNLSEFKNMQKVDVTAAYDFFSKEGKPLIWYVKNTDDEFEYFTFPGLHPVTDETLKKITEGIIEKYVPIYSNKEDSFLE